MLVGEGARTFAARRGVDVVDAGSMIAPRARREWQTWLQRLNDARDRAAGEGPTSGGKALHNIQDTVGAVTCSSDGINAAGVSR
jgi:isoaspartyl peptidase/L-asparaginase-like protein (Ntn-hydrolase superfamily)